MEPKKFLFVSLESLSGDLAWKLVKEGHKVRAYIKAASDQECYDGFFEKVSQWEPHTEWADVIIFDDIDFGEAAEKLRKNGKQVIGGSVYTDRLEVDREFGQEELKKNGVNILPSEQFSSYEEGIQFIRENPGRYVFKPSGSTFSGGKGLLFLGQEDDGGDLIDLLEQNKIYWEKKAPVFLLQKFISGVEVAVGAFFNGRRFLQPINVNFEHKRIFPGDVGPFAGEMGTLMYWSSPNVLFKATLAKMEESLQKSNYVGYIDINCIVNGKGIYPLEWTCFSADTEILTREGWKLIKDISIEQKVATLNPNTHRMEYQKVRGKISKKYRGPMIQIHGSGNTHEAIDCLVTPDHLMYIQKRNGKYGFVRADSIPQGSKIKREAKWKGRTKKRYRVPVYWEKHYLGRYHRVHWIKHPAVFMPMEVWLKFLGIFLAEGSIGGRRHFVFVSQYSKKQEVRHLLNKFPFKVVETKNGFQISSTQLAKHLLSYQFGKSATKYVPDHVKQLPSSQIRIFLDAFRIGDGNIHRRTRQTTYFSASKRLVDDIQELLLKCGVVANIRCKKAKGTSRGKIPYLRKSDIYWISERRKKKDFYVDKRNIRQIQYRGFVYCVEVPNHIIYVRRNGKAFWCGNCRFGYPTIQIQLEGITMPAGEWLWKLASGEDFEIKTKKGFQIGVRIMVPTYLSHGHDPELLHMFRDMAVTFKKSSNQEGIHIEDVKNDNGTWRIAGTSGVVLVVTATGATVEDARRLVYNRVQNIIIPNLFYRTDVGYDWVQDSDRLHTWGYLR